MSEESINKTLTNLNYIQHKHRGEESHMCSITENDALATKRYFSDGHIVRRGEITEIAKKIQYEHRDSVSYKKWSRLVMACCLIHKTMHEGSDILTLF